VTERAAAMDEAAFRAARAAATPLPCAFEKALLARCADCENARRHALAERESIACASPVARTNCATLVALTRERSAFALKAPPGAPSPHALTMKVLCGGVVGMQRALGSDERDVHRLVVAARERFGSLDALPWPEIVAAVRAWQGRRRTSGATR
jgi:hypothetical protein